jgi:hypothetical protein
MSPPIQRHPPLVPDHAFVVQLRVDTQVEMGQMAGRLEPLVSRLATMFKSLETLLACMARGLREVRNASGSPS